MSKTLHTVLHVVLIALQLVNIASVPAPWNLVVGAATAAIQGYLGVSNHSAGGPAPVQ